MILNQLKSVQLDALVGCKSKNDDSSDVSKDKWVHKDNIIIIILLHISYLY